MNKESKNPWKPEDEKVHSSSVIEWWCVEAFFKTIEDNKKWSFNTSITEWGQKFNRSGSMFKTTLFDQDNNKHFEHLDSKGGLSKLETANNGFDIRYRDSYLKGLFPDYEMRFDDTKNSIILDFKCHAKSTPRWVAQEITNGLLPMGLGSYKYGFIPKCDIFGTMKINGTDFKIEGIGYYEHVWGDFSFHSPLSMMADLKKIVLPYTKLAGWWLHNHKIKIPKSIMFSSENNPFGYDWAWALLDNGWTVFYGNIMFWVMKGPVFGTLILSKDGETYEEFCNMDFQYNKTIPGTDYDFVYPSEFEVTANKGKEKLHLCFKMTSECREFVSRFPKGKYWLAFVICEAPGVVDGYYFDGEKKTKLKGICKIEPQRQVSIFGHNSLQLDFILPPDGVGVSFNLDSHFFRKKIAAHLQLAPRPKIKFSFDRICPSKTHKNNL